MPVAKVWDEVSQQWVPAAIGAEGPQGLTGPQGPEGPPGADAESIRGGGVDEIFWENDTTVTASYTIRTGKNAMTAGPIEIQDGVTVSIPVGSTWTII